MFFSKMVIVSGDEYPMGVKLFSILCVLLGIFRRPLTLAFWGEYR